MLNTSSIVESLSESDLLRYFTQVFERKGIFLTGKRELSGTKPSPDPAILYSSYTLASTGASIAYLPDEPRYRFTYGDESLDMTLWSLIAQAPTARLDRPEEYMAFWLDEAVNWLSDSPQTFIEEARKGLFHIEGFDPKTGVFRRMSLAAAKEYNIHNLRPQINRDLDDRLSNVAPQFSERSISKWLVSYVGKNLKELMGVGPFDNFYVIPHVELPTSSGEKAKFTVPLVHYFGGSRLVAEFVEELRRVRDYLRLEHSKRIAENDERGYSEELHHAVLERLCRDGSFLRGLTPEGIDPKEAGVESSLLSVYLPHISDMGVYELRTVRGTYVPRANAMNIVENIFTPGTNVIDTADVVLVEDMTRYQMLKAMKNGLAPVITSNSIRSNGLKIVYVGDYAPKTFRKYINAWLQESKGQEYLFSPAGRSWLESKDSAWWRATPAGAEYDRMSSGLMDAIDGLLEADSLDFRALGEFSTTGPKDDGSR